jgi:imidazole glycerol-phosphate synthase subunit HisF
MLAKRVIPCLDVHDGKVTRGVQFGRAEAGGLRNVGDPVELAVRYNDQGADEMVFFDITASAQGRASMIAVIERAADQCFMPLTVGGGIRAVEDMHAMLKAGADKTSINSSALAHPELIRRVRKNSAANASLSPLTQKRSRRTVGRFFPTAGAKPRGWTPLNGPKKPWRWGPGKSSSTALTPMAPRPGLTW